MATTYWQNQHPQALTLPTKEGTTITVPQAGYVKDLSGTYYTADFGLTSVADPGAVVYAYTYPADEVGGGTPGGSSGQFQYNNAGVFGGIAGTEVTGSYVSLSPELAVNIVSVDPSDNGNSSLELSAQNYWRATFYSLADEIQHNLIMSGDESIFETVDDNTSAYGRLSLMSSQVSLSLIDGVTASSVFLNTTEAKIESTGTVKISGGNLKILTPIPVYEDRTAAIAGGLVNGELFRTSTGLLGIVVTG